LVREERRILKLDVEGIGTFDVEDDKSIVLAIKETPGWTSCIPAEASRTVLLAGSSFWRASRRT
jgi:hypothetical protein